MPRTCKAAHEIFAEDVDPVEINKTKFKKHSFCVIVTIIIVSAIALLGTSAYIFYRNGNSALVAITFVVGIVILVVASICYQWRYGLLLWCT